MEYALEQIGYQTNCLVESFSILTSWPSDESSRQTDQSLNQSSCWTVPLVWPLFSFDWFSRLTNCPIRALDQPSKIKLVKLKRDWGFAYLTPPIAATGLYQFFWKIFKHVGPTTTLHRTWNIPNCISSNSFPEYLCGTVGDKGDIDNYSIWATPKPPL